ncbi:MAG: glycosyltransferase family 1 protein [Lachnospiraceae bacterium]|nr:glycosyltransferase family 1 protein [Lachnospiraceae bacterium]
MATKSNNKISVAMVANNLEINGISSVIMNYCTHINLDEFEICIMAGSGIAECHRITCEKLGITVIELPNRKKDSMNYFRALDKSLRKRHFDIIHVHGNQSAIAIELFLGWKNGIKVRIAHSHNTTCMSMKLHKLLKPAFNMIYTDGFACGKEAGKWLFGNKPFTVIPNGFNIELFKYDETARKLVREELGVDNKLVLGNIGRINDQKNQPFLLEIFSEVGKINKDAVLLLVGTGPREAEIKELINQHPYKNRIIMYGETTSPEKMYSAMDYFVFPSKYEGLPVTVLEAQISGLSCVLSDVITQEVVINENVQKVPLDASPAIWANQIIHLSMINRECVLDSSDELKKYSINNASSILENAYLTALDKRN